MDNEILMQLGDLQTEIANSLDLIEVIADGLWAHSKESGLSGESAKRYMNALYVTFDVLSGMNGKLGEQLEQVRAHMA